MGFGLTLVSFSSGQTVSSANVNSNFSALNNSSAFSGKVISNGGLSGSVAIASGSNMDFAASASSSISGINEFSGTGSGTFNHGLSVVPDSFALCYAGVFGTNPTAILYWFSATSSSVTVTAQASYSWIGMAYKA